MRDGCNHKRVMASTPATLKAQCRCGAIEISAWGKPIAVNTCYCNDCQAAARKLAAAPQAGSVMNADGGTEFMLFRRDRIACTRGAQQLEALRLNDNTRTRRMLSTCCSTPMYMAFDDKRPWVSAFRASFGASAPPVQMQICTRFRHSQSIPDQGLPSHPGYPPAMMLRLLAAGLGVLFSRSMGTLP